MVVENGLSDGSMFKSLIKSSTSGISKAVFLMISLISSVVSVNMEFISNTTMVSNVIIVGAVPVSTVWQLISFAVMKGLIAITSMITCST